VSGILLDELREICEADEACEPKGLFIGKLAGVWGRLK
jgi:hypothetical protein